MIPIVEKEYVFRHTVREFSIEISNLELFKSVSLTVRINDIHGTFVECRYFKIEGEEYEAWGNSDEYLVQLIAEKLGFTLKAE
jgi:hypothetical protein